ncbi:anaerobic ribonucleoside-triphosphate reductase activating protein [Alkaliphilus pronyensis]|uniref:Anaerobic ribonucleoside-triphosphate reductase activating protein n=1 Tax=Alkaliphilus pronyensis TaxID=1482732 RepID=A0A6I0F1Z6_9FIRM|nr:anaerobic ribonucleoside-triphosphate reductase activating protein [Alkaliphilus pronyensis]KAB3535292.1 anaerobic ribonucleoside-triphosphate reductase activating protein [Alkaliphilus pronyensis]
MRILGITKSSFIDYPGKIATVLFTGGCNLKCPYCHNGHIVKEQAEVALEKDVWQYIIKRKRYIDAVCISGGEPTLQIGLMEFITRLKSEGFSVKLDTNGTRPLVLKDLLQKKLLDYVAMDLKAPLNKYSALTGSTIEEKDIIESINLLANSSIEHEFRTTVCKELLTAEDIISTAVIVKGAKRYYIQNFKDGETVYGGINKYTPFKKEELEKIKEQIKNWFEICEIR